MTILQLGYEYSKQLLRENLSQPEITDEMFRFFIEAGLTKDAASYVTHAFMKCLGKNLSYEDTYEYVQRIAYATH
jgi:hypothetical protein